MDLNLLYIIWTRKSKIILLVSGKIAAFNTSQTKMRTKPMRTKLEEQHFRSTPPTKLESLIFVKSAQYLVKRGRMKIKIWYEKCLKVWSWGSRSTICDRGWLKPENLSPTTTSPSLSWVKIMYWEKS